MKRLAIMAVLASALTGCAGIVSFSVPESDKDPAFAFDGTYYAKVEHPGGRQDMGAGWYSDCGPQDFAIPFRVQSSEIIWQWNDAVAKGYVNSKGRFRLEHELDDGVQGIGTVMSDGTVTLISQGDLSSNKMKGVFIMGVAQFGNQGCSYPITYAKNE